MINFTLYKCMITIRFQIFYLTVICFQYSEILSFYIFLCSFLCIQWWNYVFQQFLAVLNYVQYIIRGLKPRLFNSFLRKSARFIWINRYISRYRKSWFWDFCLICRGERDGVSERGQFKPRQYIYGLSFWGLALFTLPP